MELRCPGDFLMSKMNFGFSSPQVRPRCFLMVDWLVCCHMAADARFSFCRERLLRLFQGDILFEKAATEGGSVLVV